MRRHPKWRVLEFSFYCASIIIGAGVLTLPLAVATAGFLPLIGAIVAIGGLMYIVYERLTSNIQEHISTERGEQVARIRSVYSHIRIGGDTWEVAQRGSLVRQLSSRKQELYDDLVGRARLETWGRIALFFGMLFYVFPANIGYILIGFKSLQDLSLTIQQHKGSSLIFTFLSLLGILSLGVAFYLERVTRSTFALHATVKRMLLMLGIWLIAVAAIAFEGPFGFLKTVTTPLVAGLILYTSSVIAIMFVSSSKSVEQDQTGLLGEHRTNVYLIYAEMVLLLVTVAMVLLYFSRHGLFVMPPLLPSTNAGLKGISAMLGLVLFAYVGTGIYNLSAYSELLERRPGSSRTLFSRVALWGTVIPLVLYLVWTIVSAITIDQDLMSLLNSNRQYTTIGMATRLRNYDQVGAWLIAFFGYWFALFAVTSACNGFTETLVDRLVIVMKNSLPQAKSQLKRLGSERGFKIVRFSVLLGAMLAALFVESYEGQTELTKILAVSGNAGGGLLLLILPWFFSVKRPMQRWEVFAATVCILFLFSSNLMLAAEDWPSVVSITIGLVAFISLGIGLMLVWKEPLPNERPSQ